MPSAPRIVVADDSSFMRTLLSGALGAAGFDVVGTACDGDEALEQCAKLRPDAMTLDLAMPGLDGIGVLRALRGAGAPAVPVIVVSAFSPAHGARAVDALAEGAFDLVPKPALGEPFETFVQGLGDKLRVAAAGGHLRSSNGARAVSNGNVPTARAVAPPRAARTRRAVVIATSTGGPRALARLVPALPAQLGEGTLIVQHMPEGFTNSLAARLDRESLLTVREAAPGDRLERGTALIAPGGRHLRIGSERRARLSDEPAIGGLRPRADLTIADVATTFGEHTLLVVLTGMGRDGADGARAIREAGGRVLCEAEESCTVYGMPRAVAEAGLADAVMPLDDLAAAIALEAN
jgi:two-component system, chemotaxis family, protein-glutamate methylesterase/glutaminase